MQLTFEQVKDLVKRSVNPQASIDLLLEFAEAAVAEVDRLKNAQEVREPEHLPGCAHAENMARPRSQQLIGPKCECEAERKRSKKFREWLDSDDGKAAIEAAAKTLPEKDNDT